MSVSSWMVERPIEGVLCDITGVLYNSSSGGGTPIDGSAAAIDKLRKSGIPFKFVTNETQSTRELLQHKLARLGFTLDANEIFSPAPAMRDYLHLHKLRPHLIVTPALQPDFEGLDTSNPNCVVMADIGEDFNYRTLNDAFRLLLQLKEPRLFSLGKGKYYREGNDLVLDVGAFAAALEYSLDIQCQCIGKPCPEYFQAALQSINVVPDRAVMIGDDLAHDVGGAQKAGMRGVLVRTGKYRITDESNPDVQPDAIVENLADFVNQLIS